MAPVRFVWRDCDLCSGDAFWVEASKNEAEISIFPLLSDAVISESEKQSNNSGGIVETLGNPNLTYCYLISKDLKFIRPFPDHYPIHQLWNAYSPFEEISEVHIKEISELDEISL